MEQVPFAIKTISYIYILSYYILIYRYTYNRHNFVRDSYIARHRIDRILIMNNISLDTQQTQYIIKL